MPHVYPSLCEQYKQSSFVKTLLHSTASGQKLCRVSFKAKGCHAYSFIDDICGSRFSDH